jgi:cholesterol oxidase
MRKLSAALGGVYIPSPLWAAGGRGLLTAHPLGGCAMSADPSSGVVDELGAVHGYRDLFVVDGSIVPTALSRNPTATISALAERAVFHMIHDREMRDGDAEMPANDPPDLLKATLGTGLPLAAAGATAADERSGS